MSAKDLADVAESIRRSGLAFMPAPLVRSLTASSVRLAMRHEEAVGRVYDLCAIVCADPAEILAAAQGDTAALEEWAHTVARTRSTATLSALAAELADA